MSGNAYLLTKRRLTDDHYLAIALRGARDMNKPPITIGNVWKHIEQHDDREEQLQEIYNWLEQKATAGDYVVLDGNEECVKAIADYAQKHQLVAVKAIWAEKDSDEKDTIKPL